MVGRQANKGTSRFHVKGLNMLGSEMVKVTMVVGNVPHACCQKEQWKGAQRSHVQTQRARQG